VEVTTHFSIPSKENLKIIQNDKNFRSFLQKVIVCTEEGYKQEEFEKMAAHPHTLEHKEDYNSLLVKVIEELLREGAQYKLQTFGYQLEQTPKGPIVVCNQINLNK
jgi:hypothetical protein